MTVNRHSLFPCSRVVLLAGGALFWLAAGTARAQTRAVAAPAAEVRIRDLPKMGRASLVRSPEYQHKDRRTAGSSRRRESALLAVG